MAVLNIMLMREYCRVQQNEVFKFPLYINSIQKTFLFRWLMGYFIN
jgi:hypothetical protein